MGDWWVDVCEMLAGGWRFGLLFVIRSLVCGYWVGACDMLVGGCWVYVGGMSVGDWWVAVGEVPVGG